MKKIVIHIGTHKTGTSSIQEALERSRSHLQARSIWYARTDREPHAHLPKHSSLTHALIKGGQAAEAELSILLSEFTKSSCQTLILSAEGLSELDEKVLAPLRSLSADFDVRVVGYLRRPDYYIEALWNQFCREGREKRSIVAFSKAPRVIERTNYAALLDVWSCIGTVRAADFETAKRRGILGLFGELAEIDLPAETEIHGNPSPSMNCAASLAMLNADGADYDLQTVLAAFEADSRPFALGARRRQKLLEKVGPALDRLATEYGVSFDTDLPDEPEDPLLQPETGALIEALAFLASSRSPNASREHFVSTLKARLSRRG